MRLGFAANPEKQGVAAQRDRLLASARAMGHMCSVYDHAWQIEQQTEPLPEALVVFGGDGTLLRYARPAAVLGIPILGVNLGRIGFLSEILVEEFEQAMERVTAGDYTVERRMMLAARVNDGAPALCLNDIVVSKRSFSGTAQILLSVNGMTVANVFCDGIIAATPTGSTAYSLSAGGPVIAPGLSGIVVTPVCSHTLHVRPIVSAADDLWELRLLGDGFVAADGVKACDVGAGDRITVTKAKETAPFIRFSEKNVFELIKQKLS